MADKEAKDKKDVMVGGPATLPKGGGVGKGSSHKKSLSGRQKAAIFLVTLGSGRISRNFQTFTGR